jgi:hypothetical protein
MLENNLQLPLKRTVHHDQSSTLDDPSIVLHLLNLNAGLGLALDVLDDRSTCPDHVLDLQSKREKREAPILAYFLLWSCA